jgi:hypothetical protein
MIASFASMEALDTLIELHSLDKSSFIRDGIETSVDELAGRLGARIIRDGDRLLRT